MGRIIELIISFDGKIRSAKIMLPTRRTTCLALKHLYPIECPGDSEIFNEESKNDHEKEPKDLDKGKPSRKAAIIARENLRQLLIGEECHFSG